MNAEIVALLEGGPERAQVLAQALKCDLLAVIRRLKAMQKEGRVVRTDDDGLWHLLDASIPMARNGLVVKVKHRQVKPKAAPVAGSDGSGTSWWVNAGSEFYAKARENQPRIDASRIGRWQGKSMTLNSDGRASKPIGLDE